METLEWILAGRLLSAAGCADAEPRMPPGPPGVNVGKGSRLTPSLPLLECWLPERWFHVTRLLELGQSVRQGPCLG